MLLNWDRDLEGRPEEPTREQPREDEMSEEPIGVVDHWYGGIDVAGVTVTGEKLSVGDKVRFVGHTTDFATTVGSMQIDHESVQEAINGDQVGIKVPQRVRVGDDVFLVREA